MNDKLREKIIEARRLGLKGKEALAHVGAKLAGIGEKITYRRAKK